MQESPAQPEVPGLVPGAYVIVRPGSSQGGVPVRIEQVTPFGLWVRVDQRRWDKAHPEAPAKPSALHFYPYALTQISIYDQGDGG